MHTKDLILGLSSFSIPSSSLNSQLQCPSLCQRSSYVLGPFFSDGKNRGGNKSIILRGCSTWCVIFPFPTMFFWSWEIPPLLYLTFIPARWVIEDDEDACSFSVKDSGEEVLGMCKAVVRAHFLFFTLSPHSVFIYHHMILTISCCRVLQDFLFLLRVLPSWARFWNAVVSNPLI